MLPLVLAGGLLGWLVVTLVAPLRRFLAGTARRRRQLETAARASFHEEAVSGTRGRGGVLVYASALEDEATLVPDHPLFGRAPRAEWERLARLGRRDGRPLADRVEAIIAGLGELGAAHAPPESDNPNELPDEIKVG